MLGAALSASKGTAGSSLSRPGHAADPPCPMRLPSMSATLTPAAATAGVVVNALDVTGGAGNVLYDQTGSQPLEVVSSSTVNGTIGVTVSGGTAPYSYRWSNSDTTANLIALP